MFIAVLLERYDAAENEEGLGQPAGGDCTSALENPPEAPARDDNPLVMKSRRESAELMSRGMNSCVTIWEPVTLRSYNLVHPSRMVILPEETSRSNVAPEQFTNQYRSRKKMKT